MSLWHNILVGILIVLIASTVLGLLATALLHVRFQAAWFGMWAGDLTIPHEKFLRIEYGFPGFMRTWRSSDAGTDERHDDPRTPPTREAPETASPKSAGGEPGAADTMTAAPGAQARPAPQTAPGGPEGARAAGDPGGPPPRAHAEQTGQHTAQRAAATPSPLPKRLKRRTPRKRGDRRFLNLRRRRKTRDPHRHRKALFRFATDGVAWRLASGYFLRVAARAFRLPGLHVELSVGHPDPAWLGRFAGRWYAISPWLPPERALMNFRFQDRQPSFGVRARGGFSLLAFLWFLAVNAFTFPWLRLGRRAWIIWRYGTLAGWRAWSYRKIQTL